MEGTHFVKLPSELRNRIYDLVIGVLPSKKPTNIGKACQVDVTRVCRQMRAETLPMCFSIITARINIVSNVRHPFNHIHEVASLDHQWTPCRAFFMKGASNIMAIAQRISLHPQACYNSLACLKLNIILDAEDYGFGLAWQVWEPHFHALFAAIKERNLGEGRVSVHVQYHTFLDEKKEALEYLTSELEMLGLRPAVVWCIKDQDYMAGMEVLRKQWRELKAAQLKSEKDRKVDKHMPMSILGLLSRSPEMRMQSVEARARVLQDCASQRGESLGGLY